MRVAGYLVMGMGLSLFAGAAWGQAGAVISGPEPAAIDPVYTAPAASLTPQQVAGMQKLGADWPQLGRYRVEDGKLGLPARVLRFIVLLQGLVVGD